MCFDTPPELHDEHQFEVDIADSHLIGQTTDLAEQVTSSSQMSNQFVTLAGDNPRVVLRLRKSWRNST